ncbi:MAG: TolC family protein [Acidobacteriota bacterium]
MKAILGFFLLSSFAFAEVHTLTLRQALDRALEQNPDVLISRLDENKARSQVSIAKDPYSFKAGVGSGGAYTYGVPSSINGNAPSVFRAQGSMTLFDRPQSYRVAQASENVRGASIDISIRQEEIAYRVYAAFLDAELAARNAQVAEQLISNLKEVKSYHEARVAEGREHDLTIKQANLDILRADKTVRDLKAAQDSAETSLGQLLAYAPGDQVHPALESRGLLTVPESQTAMAQAIAANLDIRRMESNIQAKLLEVKSFDAGWLPKVNLISDYSLLSKFNNFDTFYKKFQRNNFQIGASIELPLFQGRATGAGRSQAEDDIAKMRIEIDRTRSRITADLKLAYSDVDRSEGDRQLAREDLNLAGDKIKLDLADYEEGRVPMAVVEASRAIEQQKWIAYYAAQKDVELARLNILRTTGGMLASLK